MKNFFWLFVILLFINCNEAIQPSSSKNEVTTASEENIYPIIPMPVSLLKKEGQFEINNSTFLKNFQKGNYFETFGMSVNGPKIFFVLDEHITSEEGYKLTIDKENIVIKHRGKAGAFYAFQTMRQLLTVDGKLPCCEIIDEPRFEYRGMHLDVCRHFFPVDFIKKYIDLLAFHKMNRFHWHLTEDQGWRIEIKKYPLLQEVAAYRDETLIGHYSDQPHQFDGKKYGGYYTQEEIKEIVRYAKDRFVEVVPEIEMPGHSQAALAAYPELGCGGGPHKTATKWGVFEDVYCPHDKTFSFLEDVIDEVVELFPYEYIHIGGDECPKTAWKNSEFCQNLIKEKGLKDEHGLQSYFISKMEKYINSKGKNIIGWDEILEGGLAPNATVMSWRGMQGGIDAAKQKHQVIMTPTSNCYLDYYQSIDEDEPLAIGGFLPLKKVYNFEPTPESLSGEEAKYILGAQGNVWTEYMPTTDQVEYMAYPRACALAEVVWSPAKEKNYDGFVSRLVPHLDKLKKLDVNYANHVFEIVPSVQSSSDDRTYLILESKNKAASIHYTTDGSIPTAKSPQFEKSILLQKDKLIKAKLFSNGNQLGKLMTLDYKSHQAICSGVSFKEEPSKTYSMGGAQALVNGVYGSDDRYGDNEWLGWWGKDVGIDLEFLFDRDIEKVTFRFYNGKGQWIYPPKSVELLHSKNGKDYSPLKIVEVGDTDNNTISTSISFDEITTKFLKIKIKRHGIIADGKQGAGQEAWTFVDEIFVE